jgi:hypothetical protein
MKLTLLTAPCWLLGSLFDPEDEVVHCSETLVSQPAQHSIPEDSFPRSYSSG